MNRSLGPMDAAVLVALATTTAIRALLVPLVALLLLLVGYRPARQFQPAPVVARTKPLTVQRLRSLVRRQHGSAVRPGGRRIAQATKADLLAALYGEAVAA